MPHYPSGIHTPTQTGDIVSLYRVTYENNFIEEHQQRMPKLLNLVKHYPDNMSRYLLIAGIDQLDSDADNLPEDVTQRFGDTSWNYLNTYRRRMSLMYKTWAYPFDPDDAEHLMLDPKSPAMSACIYAYNRMIDTEIATAMFRDVTQVQIDTNGAESESTVSFASANRITTDLDGLDETHIREAVKILKSGDVDLDYEPPLLVISPQQELELSDKERVTSGDYVGTHPLIEGEVKKFYGASIVVSNRLPTVTVEGTTYRRCALWVPSSMGFAGTVKPQVDVGPRREKQFTMQLQTRMRFGAIRRQEGGIVEIRCAEVG